MSNEVLKKDEREIKYKPFGSEDEITLTIKMVRDTLSSPTKSGKQPTDIDCIKFLMLCKARRLNPWEGDAFLVGYDTNSGPKFNLITAHQAFLKRAETNPDFDGLQSGIIIEEDGQIKEIEGDFFVAPQQKVLGGWSKVYFKTKKYPMYKRIRLSRFNKGFGVWVDDAPGMICKCAEADSMRSAFPNLLGGLYMREETREADSPIVSTPIFGDGKEMLQKTAEAKVIDITPPAEVKVAPVPEAPTAAAKPAPRPVKAPSQPKTPPTPVEALKARIDASGVTVEKVLGALVRLQLAEDSINTLEELLIQRPDAFQLLVDDLESIVSDLKS